MQKRNLQIAIIIAAVFLLLLVVKSRQTGSATVEPDSELSRFIDIPIYTRDAAEGYPTVEDPYRQQYPGQPYQAPQQYR